MRDAICSFIGKATPFKACCQAEDGDSAVRKAKERVPDLVILDLGMPNMNGIETASILRGMLPSVKIIGFTGHAADFQDVAMSVGFDAMLNKAQGIAKLAEAINALLPGTGP